LDFHDLGLRAALIRAVREQGYTVATPIQARAIPAVLSGRDVMAAAQTGSGKTAAFALPILQRLMGVRPGPARTVRALVMVPTRELAAQVARSVRAYGAHLPLECTAVFGGVGMQPQLDVLRRGVDLLVATPGRLLDHVGRGSVDLSQIEIFVLDEADRMLDMGFIHDVRRTIGLMPSRRQSLLFSATFPDEVQALAGQLLDAPELIEQGPRNTAPATIEQDVYRVDRNRKTELLAELVHRGGWSRVLVFTRTKHGANRLAHKLARAGISAGAIHGNKSQSARTRALADFKAGRLRTLIATEVASRGLDIEALPHVVNFELPLVAEDYLHRIGRTGRAGASGRAVSLVCVDEDKLLGDIERVIGHKLSTQTLAGFEPDPGVRPEPITKGRGARAGNGRSRSAPSGRGPRAGTRPRARVARGARER